MACSARSTASRMNSLVSSISDILDQAVRENDRLLL